MRHLLVLATLITGQFREVQFFQDRVVIKSMCNGEIRVYLKYLLKNTIISAVGNMFTFQ